LGTGLPQFRYTAISPSGEMQRGVLDAASEADVVAQLRRQGSLPMRAELASEGGVLAPLLQAEFLPRRGLSASQVANLTRELATMLSAGQDLDRAFRYVVETAATPRVRRVLERLRDAVRDGSPLSAALTREPDSFSRLYIGMVRAGEASGQLGEALKRLAELLERQRRIAATVTSALIYPCLLVVVAIGAVTLLLTQVLPQFVPLFEQSGAKLPASTQFLIDTGAFVADWGVLMLLAAAVLILLGTAVLRRPGPRLVVDRLLLRLPIVGSLQRELIAARLTRALGTLLENGVPLIAAMAIARDALGKRAAMAALDRASQSARGGRTLAEPLAEAAVLPVRTIHLLRLGEENAQLGAMALHAAEIHEEASRVSVQRLVALLVPVITIVMGAAVAGIVASLLSAMLSLNNLAAS
jgi:general secretion pathway protein F